MCLMAASSPEEPLPGASTVGSEGEEGATAVGGATAALPWVAPHAAERELESTLAEGLCAL